MADILLANAWGRVSTVAIKKCWNVLMSKNEHWTGEDDLSLILLRNQIAEEASITPSISKLLQDVMPDINLTDNEIAEWIREDYSEKENVDIDVSDEEIVETTQTEQKQKVKVDEVIKSIDICIEWATENDISYEKLIALQEIKESAIFQKAKKSKTQTKISTFFSLN